MLRLLAFVLLVGVAPVAAQPATPAAAPPSSRELERLNWMEVRALVPARIDTVLLPLGTLEPHGVTANGADFDRVNAKLERLVLDTIAKWNLAGVP
jgi:creatinine amidohydrolase